MANFLLKFRNFRYHGNRGWCDTNFFCTVKFADPETLCFVQELGNLLYKQSYSKFSVKIWKIFVTMATGVV